ncbi:hypothetical protein PMAYCL1PPCAC_20270, partial [Pristionchus mayeri]
APISQSDQLLKKWRSSLNDEVYPCTPVAVPEETIIERILSSLNVHASNHPQKAAVIEAVNQERSLTYEQIHDRAFSFGSFLQAHGFSVGERVTVALPNSIEFPVVHLGTWAAGGSVVGSIEAFKLHETVHQLRDSSSTVVVVSERTLNTIIDAAKQCPNVKMIICVRYSDGL